MEEIEPEFTYEIFQTMINDATILNFMNSYSQELWGEIFRELILHAIRAILAKYHNPPPVERISSFCNSDYDSHSPYIVYEEVNDIRNKILGIDRQLFKMLDSMKSKFQPVNIMQNAVKKSAIMSPKLSVPGSSTSRSPISATRASTAAVSNIIYTPLHSKYNNNEQGNFPRSISTCKNNGKIPPFKHSVLVPQLTEPRNELDDIEEKIEEKLMGKASTFDFTEIEPREVPKTTRNFKKENKTPLTSRIKLSEYTEPNTEPKSPIQISQPEYESKGVLDLATEFLNNSIANKFTSKPQCSHENPDPSFTEKSFNIVDQNNPYEIQNNDLISKIDENCSIDSVALEQKFNKLVPGGAEKLKSKENQSILMKPIENTNKNLRKQAKNIKTSPLTYRKNCI